MAAVGIASSRPKHAHSGAGLTSYRYLKEVYEKNGCLPYSKKPSNRKHWDHHVESGEISFTEIYTQLGYKLKKTKARKSYIRWTNIGGAGQKQSVKRGVLDSNSTVDRKEWGKWWEDPVWKDLLNKEIKI